MTVRLLVPAVGKQANALYTSTAAAERALIDAGQADRNLDASFEYQTLFGPSSWLAPPITSGPSLSLSTSTVASGVTGNVAQLASSLSGNVTYSKVSGAASVAVSSVGAVTLSAGLANGATATFIGRGQNDAGDAIERSLTLTGVSSGVTPTPTLSGTLLAGQSQAVRMFGKMPAYAGTNASLGVAISPNAQVLARYTDTARTVSTAVLGVPADGGPYDSTFAAEYTRVMENLTGRPQLLAGHAVGSTTIAQWQPGQQNHTDLLGVISAMPVGFDRAVFFLGGTDAGNGTSAAAFKTGLSGYFDSLAQYNKPAGTAFQKIVIVAGTRLSTGAGSTDQVQTIRKAAQEWCAANGAIYLEPHDLVLEDDVHQGQPGSITLARVIARAAKAGADSSPALVSTGVRTTTAITLTASGALTQVGNPANRFSVFNSGTSSGALAIASMSVSGATITLNLSADPGSGQALDVYWLRHPDPSGSTAAANILYDTYTADGLPNGRQLQPTVSGPVSVPAPGGTPTPTPSPSFSDTFTAADGTAVSSRNADTGQAYTALTSDFLIQSNRAYPQAATTETLGGFVPASADYFLSAQYTFVSVVSGQAVYVEGRHNGSASNSSAYFFGYRASTGGWIIGKSVAGTFTVLVSQAYTPVAGDVKLMRGEMSGTTLKLFIDGTQILTTTDTSVAGPGKIAIRSAGASTSTTGIHIDNLTAGALT